LRIVVTRAVVEKTGFQIKVLPRTTQIHDHRIRPRGNGLRGRGLTEPLPVPSPHDVLRYIRPRARGPESVGVQECHPVDLAVRSRVTVSHLQHVADRHPMIDLPRSLAHWDILTLGYRASWTTEMPSMGCDARHAVRAPAGSPNDGPLSDCRTQGGQQRATAFGT
jgi:hypothetical protein